MIPISEKKKNIRVIPTHLELLFGIFNNDSILAHIEKGLSLTFKETLINEVVLKIELLEAPKTSIAPLFIAFGKRLTDSNNPDNLIYSFRGANYFFYNGNLMPYSNNDFFYDKEFPVDFVIFSSKVEFHFNAQCFRKHNELRLTA